MDYNDSIFGADARNTSHMPATMLTPTADSDWDWNAIIGNGIRGAAQGAILAATNERFASGQLRAPIAPPGAQGINLQTLLILGALAYVLMKA